MQFQDQRERDSHLWFLTFSQQIWGPLCNDKWCIAFNSFHFQIHPPLHSEAPIFFQPGMSREGWFTANHLLAQVNDAIDIFDRLTCGYAEVLFLFNNAPSHQKQADAALSACLMVKGASIFIYHICQSYLSPSKSGPKKGQTHNSNGACMCNGTLLNGC